MLKSLNRVKYISAAILLASLWGCGSTPSADKEQLAVVSLVSAPQAPAEYLAFAAKAPSKENRERYLLLATNAYLKQGDTDAAADILRSMQAGLSPVDEIQAEHRFLSARLQELTGKSAEALNTLNYPGNWQLPDWQWASYHQARARLFAANQQPVEQVRELSQLSQYLPVKATGEVNDEIWQLLKPLQEETLQSFAAQESDAVFTGWLQLAYLAKHYAVDPSSLIRQLSDWQKRNPYHPAAVQLPSDLQLALSAKPYRPSNIAVLLPLSGPRAGVANTVRQGILASYLSEPDSNVSLNFFDTAQGADRAYQQALQSGAEFVIGPLLQNEVEQVMAAQQAAGASTPPQLFLNQIDKLAPQQNKYYFALSPTQEASDAARRMYQDGIQVPLLLASNDAVGQRMAQSFKQTWMELTDSDAEVHFYDNGDKMRETVESALGVTDSKARIQAIKALLGSKVKADFRSRTDIDAIYMISGIQDLPLLKPFIDVNFSVFAEQVPLYTSSRARQEDNAKQTAIELNNITISDIPWLLQASEETEVVNKLWPTWGNAQKRLYVMGYDALQLVNRLAQMHAFPGYQYNGRSGQLTVSPDGVIDRQLSWAKYQRGVLRPL
ncbi:MAG: penicillin-binding protein activator [Shewanella sp.]|uniref:penicillin-binding protein activator n=1 Tax=Shewanella sp. TaxID=50422 RepID=UPI001ECF717B|nr:penicillin-binding protein activator [Shewanella sp.]MBZ4677525.1 penicillin-binding protein activator [Shewanella sp.]